MAAFISKVNACEFCTKAHAAVAARAYQDEAKVSAVLSDLETASIKEPLRATLRMPDKLTREHAVDSEDMRMVLAAGACLRGWREIPARARRPLRESIAMIDHTGIGVAGVSRSAAFLRCGSRRARTSPGRRCVIEMSDLPQHLTLKKTKHGLVASSGKVRR